MFARNEPHRDNCINYLREILKEIKKSNETFVFTILGLIIAAFGLFESPKELSNTIVPIICVCVVLCLSWLITKVITSEIIESLLSKRQEDIINNYIVHESIKKVKKTKKTIDLILIIVIVSLSVTLLYNLYIT